MEIAMTINEYYELITDTKEKKHHLDRISKQAARGFLLTSMAGADTPPEMISKILKAFESDCDSISSFDAATISKLIPDSALKQRGILIED